MSSHALCERESSLQVPVFHWTEMQQAVKPAIFRVSSVALSQRESRLQYLAGFDVS